MRREVQVKAAFADLYPSLEPGRWYTAAAVAGLVKGTRIITEGLDVEFSDRLLHPDHFEFRGGGPRRGGWMGVRSRRLDRHAALSGSSWSGRGRRPDWGGEFS